MCQNFPATPNCCRSLGSVCSAFIFDDVSLDVCEVLSQVRTPLPLDLFFKHLSIAAKQQLFYGKCNGCWLFLEAIR